jgi:RAD51-like protein 2
MKRLRLTPVTNLPLRPSTLKLLQSRGFDTVEELHEAKASGVSQLAADLGVSGGEAVRIFREVVGVAESSSLSSLSAGASASAASATSGSTSTLAGHNLLLSTAAPSLHPRPKTASQLLEEHAAGASSGTDSQGQHQNANGAGPINRHIVTFCRELDQLLGGGVALNELTEFAGAPGLGKTQLAMQLAVTARLPLNWGGVEGETLYVDSEGSFSPERCWSMAEALVSHIRSVHRKRRRDVEVPEWFTPRAILDGIHVIRVHDLAAQTATLLSLEERLRQPKAPGGCVRLVVVDSVAFHVRASALMALEKTSTTTLSSRQQHQKQRSLLVALASHLNQVASRHTVAVVATNQMTTVKACGSTAHPSSSSAAPASDSFTLVPALGEAWAHAVSNRLVLHQPSHHPSDGAVAAWNAATAPAQPQQQQRRTCQLVKSPRLPSGAADLVILEAGIRGVSHVATSSSSSGGTAGRPQQQQHRPPPAPS